MRTFLGVLGALIFAGAGAVMGAQNAGWGDLDRNANALIPIMGIGAALVIAAFSTDSFSRDVGRSGGLGKTARVLLIVGTVAYILSALIQFAIIGTLTFGIGLVCLAILVVRRKLVPVLDRVLIAMSAIASLTWNTETVSAFLLVVVGTMWVILSARLLPADRAREA